MVLPLYGSVWGRAQKEDNAAAWPLEFCWRGSCPPALAQCQTVQFSPYATVALPAAALVLEPRRSESVSPKSAVGLLGGDS